jgi:hypothetical protein
LRPLLDSRLMQCFPQVWLPIIVNVLTLIAVGWYAWLTRGIAESAREQAEASQKPVIALKCISREDHSDQIMERLAQEHVPQAAKFALAMGASFVIKNIGTGPALNLFFDFEPTGPGDSKDPKDPNRYARKFPYLAPTDGLETPITVASVLAGDYKFVARYQSLSGKKYLTEMIMHARSGNTVVLREDWIFTPLK